MDIYKIKPRIRALIGVGYLPYAGIKDSAPDGYAFRTFRITLAYQVEMFIFLKNSQNYLHVSGRPVVRIMRQTGTPWHFSLFLCPASSILLFFSLNTPRSGIQVYCRGFYYNSGT